MSDFQILVLLILLNLLIVEIYMLVHLRKKRRKKGMILLLFMLFMPIVGAGFLLFGELFQQLQKIFGNRIVSLEDLSFSQKRQRDIVEENVEEKLNLVPVEEALSVSGKEGRRMEFLNMIKDADESVPMKTIRRAEENSDGEIAHYAATFLSDSIARAKAEEKRLRELRNPDTGEWEMETRISYIVYMEKMLRMQIFERDEQRVYLLYLDDACQKLLKSDSLFETGSYLACLASLWLTYGDIERTGYWLRVLEPEKLSSLETFKLYARYYFSIRDWDALRSLLNEVKQSDLILDSEALEWIRFYDD